MIDGTVKEFLGTQASFGADLNLMIQIAMGVALLAGAFLARAKRYSAHGACMATVLLLNLMAIVAVMWPSFEQLVLPRLARHLNKRYFKARRFRRWKLWMRVELALWVAVLLSGIGTYVVWYAPRWGR